MTTTTRPEVGQSIEANGIRDMADPSRLGAGARSGGREDPA